MFCAVHKHADHVDLFNKRCDAPGCNTLANFGVPGHAASKCAKHADRHLHIFKSNPRCNGRRETPHNPSVRCNEPATHGTDRVLRHCEAHASPDEVDMVQRPCSECNLDSILNAAGKCFYCADAVRVQLAKQNALMQHLDTRGYPGLSTDRMVDGGACGRERPDRVFESRAGDLILLLECDEHQHKDRVADCERRRMLNLAQAFGGTPVLFVRWNPDTYKPAVGKQVSLNKRYDTLCAVLKQYLSSPCRIRDLCSVIYLFFDGYAGVQTPVPVV